MRLVAVILCLAALPSPLTELLLPSVGSWLIPGSGALCPPANAHAQFGAGLSLSPAHSCDRYSSLRSHRPAPYASPYTHRNSSPGKAASLGKGALSPGRVPSLWNWGSDFVGLSELGLWLVSVCECPTAA